MRVPSAADLLGQLARVERKLTPERYWRARAAAHPIDGLAPNAVDAGLAVLAERGASSLILSPHRDDAALSMGGALATRAHGERAVVLNVFTTSGYLGEGFAPRTIEHVTRLRGGEEARAAALLGYGELSLGLWEVDLRSFFRARVERGGPELVRRFGGDPELRGEAERDAIVRALLGAVERLRPARLYLPLAVGAHADHLVVRELALGALPRVRARAPGIEVWLYEDLYYAIAPKPELSTQAMRGELERRGHALTPRLVDVSEGYASKEDAVAAHRSQFSREEVLPSLRAHAARLGAEIGPGRLAELALRLD